MQIAAYSAPFHKVFVLHGTPGTVEYDCIDHTRLEKMPDPDFWKEQAKQAKGKPLLCIVDDYSCEGLDKAEKRNMEMMLRTCCSHLGILCLITCHAHTNLAPKWRRCCTTRRAQLAAAAAAALRAHFNSTPTQSFCAPTPLR